MIQEQTRIPLSETVAVTALEESHLTQGEERTPADVAQMVGSLATQVEDLNVPDDRKRRVLLNAVQIVNGEVDDLLDARAIRGDVARAVAVAHFRHMNRAARRRIL